MEIRKKKFKTRIELDDYYESFGRLFVCPYLRSGGGWWVARFKEPCENCTNKACLSRGKPFKYPKKLMILVIERGEKDEKER